MRSVCAKGEYFSFANLPLLTSFLQSNQGVRVVCIPEETVPPDGGGVTKTEGGDDGGNTAVRKGRRKAEDDR